MRIHLDNVGDEPGLWLDRADDDPDQGESHACQRLSLAP
jgi:hypothetical protein